MAFTMVSMNWCCVPRVQVKGLSHSAPEYTLDVYIEGRGGVLVGWNVKVSCGVLGRKRVKARIDRYRTLTMEEANSFIRVSKVMKR